jgi:hypothetical protein
MCADRLRSAIPEAGGSKPIALGASRLAGPDSSSIKKHKLTFARGDKETLTIAFKFPLTVQARLDYTCFLQQRNSYAYDVSALVFTYIEDRRSPL